jgi:hypothetical protein
LLISIEYAIRNGNYDNLDADTLASLHSYGKKLKQAENDIPDDETEKETP